MRFSSPTKAKQIRVFVITTLLGCHALPCSFHQLIWFSQVMQTALCLLSSISSSCTKASLTKNSSICKKSGYVTRSSSRTFTSGMNFDVSSSSSSPNFALLSAFWWIIFKKCDMIANLFHPTLFQGQRIKRSLGALRCAAGMFSLMCIHFSEWLAAAAFRDPTGARAECCDPVPLVIVAMLAPFPFRKMWACNLLT